MCLAENKGLKQKKNISLRRLTREALIKSCGQKDWDGRARRVGGYEYSKGRERAWDPGVRSGSLSRL